jgi:hypothetical protein
MTPGVKPPATVDTALLWPIPRWTARSSTSPLPAAARAPTSTHPSNEERALEQIAAARAEREQLPEVGREARAKAAVAEHVLAERERAAATAARLSPSDYITRELGERPSDPAKAREWDKAVQGVEGYRVRNGVGGRDTALGRKPQDHSGA